MKTGPQPGRSVSNNVATAYQAAGDSGRAILLFERTLADRERVLGEDHPGTLASCINLAAVFQTSGESSRVTGPTGSGHRPSI